MTRVSNDEFLTTLRTVSAPATARGTVFLTFKRFDPKQQQQEPDTAQPSPDMNTATSSTDKFPCLARLQTKRAKASTLIAPDQTAAFMRAYTDIVRGTVASTLRAAGDAARGAGKKKRKKGKSAAGGQLSPKQ